MKLSADRGVANARLARPRLAHLVLLDLQDLRPAVLLDPIRLAILVLLLFGW